jgi:hypothetical protein
MDESYTYNYPYIPPRMRAALDAYRLEHKPVGGFLQAVIANDLVHALARADQQNRQTNVLQDIIWYVHNELSAPALDYAMWIASGAAGSDDIKQT